MFVTTENQEPPESYPQYAPNVTSAPFLPLLFRQGGKDGAAGGIPSLQVRRNLYMDKRKRRTRRSAAWFLFFDDLQQLHGTCLDADAAGGALAGIWGVFVLDDQAEGTGLDALAAAGAELAADHPDALRVLGDGAGGTGCGALAALDADHGLRLAVALNALDGLTSSRLAYIPLYVNLGVEAEYAVTKKFSVWLRGDNLLNMNVQRFPCYNAGGIGFTAGIILNL